jgi:xanthine permease XanP
MPLMKRPVSLLYAVDETPPPGTLIIAALQHVAVMSNSLVYPIILARQAGLSSGALIDFSSRSMFVLGMSTILLCARSRFTGSGYLCPAGFTQIYLGPSLLAVQRGGLALVAGMTIIAGFLQCVMAPLLRRLRFILPSDVCRIVTVGRGGNIEEIRDLARSGEDCRRYREPLKLALQMIGKAVDLDAQLVIDAVDF